MQKNQSFRDLTVWQRSMDLVEHVYTISNRFPGDERFGLTAQIRRAAVSVPSNIAEGSRRKKRNVFRNYLRIALGSQAEIEVQLEVALRLRFLPLEEYKSAQAEVEEVGRMLNGLINSLQPER